MKYFILVLVAIVAVASATTPEELKEKIVQVRTKCIKDTGVSEDVVTQARNGVVTESDPKLREYLVCYLKSLGALNEEGVLQKEVIKARLGLLTTEENVNKILEQCIVQKDNVQETAVEYIKCTMKIIPGVVDSTKN